MDVPHGAAAGNIHIRLTSDLKINYEIYARFSALPTHDTWDYFYTNKTSSSDGSMFFMLYNSSEESVNFYILYVREGSWNFGLRYLNSSSSTSKAQTTMSISLERCPKRCSSHGQCQSTVDASGLTFYRFMITLQLFILSAFLSCFIVSCKVKYITLLPILVNIIHMSMHGNSKYKYVCMCVCVYLNFLDFFLFLLFLPAVTVTVIGTMGALTAVLNLYLIKVYFQFEMHPTVLQLVSGELHWNNLIFTVIFWFSFSTSFLLYKLKIFSISCSQVEFLLDMKFSWFGNCKTEAGSLDFFIQRYFKKNFSPTCFLQLPFLARLWSMPQICSFLKLSTFEVGIVGILIHDKSHKSLN